ncbi:phosphoserine phosphatase [Pyxicephalus adspersus]|uniref:phosphoserine phosphatase n=1 Tax=Pyxicephalus adspersus TaxID=30357 RepID=UPI003B5A0C31
MQEVTLEPGSRYPPVTDSNQSMCTQIRRVHYSMSTVSQLKELFRRADAVCFDVDSTVIKEEGIDELAKFCGVGDAVAEIFLPLPTPSGFIYLAHQVPILMGFLSFFLGEYAGFDEAQLTAESGGKGKVIGLLKEKYGFRNVVMIGDGATDMEACPPADGFIGFGGNVIRQQVKEKAKWYITDFEELLRELDSDSIKMNHNDIIY